MADREAQVTFEDEEGLVTETESRDERQEPEGAKEGDPGYDWAFPATTIEGTVAPAETPATPAGSLD